jgi:uncharacterized protein (TIGR02246 family)
VKPVSIAICAAALLTLVCGSAGRPENPPQATAEDEAAIKSIALARVESFNRHEPPPSGSFTADADFVNVYGMWRKGPAEIENRQKERMETVLKDAQIKLLDLRIRFIRPDVAIVHELHEMSGMRDDAGEIMPPHQEHGIRVLVKEQDKWLITAFHNTIVRPTQTAAPAR